MIEEHAARFVQRDPLFFQQHSKRTGCRRPERAGPFLATFAFQANTGWRFQTQVAGLHADDFADSGTRIEHEAQENMISTTAAYGAIDAVENRLDFGKFQMLDLTMSGSLEWDTQNPLGERQVFWVICGHISKEGMNGAQPYVASANLIVRQVSRCCRKATTFSPVICSRVN